MAQTSAPAPPAPGGGVFRPRALQGLSAPSDQLDQLLRLTSARGWIALLALVSVVIAGVLYGFLGNIPTTVSGRGIFLPAGGLIRVDAPAAGTLTTINARVGDRVTRGSPIATLRASSGAGLPVTSAVSGTVTEVLVDVGNYVVPGAELAVVEPVGEHVTAIIYVSAGQGKAVEPGMAAHLAPSTAPSEQYGQVIGTVTSVSEFPVSSERMQFLLQNEVLVADLTALGAVLEVLVTATVDQSTRSGLSWTSRSGAPFEVHNGTLTTGSVTIQAETPARKLFDPRE